MVKITINGMEVSAQDNMTVFEAAETAGIYIPTLCHHPDLSTFGACRVCMVDADGKIVTACRAPVKEGMVVKTNTEEVNQVRRVAVELILANHNEDCQSCSENNHCKLQEVSAFVGVTPERMGRMRRTVNDVAIDESNPFFALDRSKCILCGVCIRTCEEINGATALDFGFRGYETSVVTLGNKPFLESKCVSCGECVERCPTGALARQQRDLPEREVKTVCSYCGVGCSMYLGVRGDSVVSVRGDKESPANDGHLCVKGRFGYGFIDHPDRLKKPLVRRDGVLEETTWDEALDLVASKIGEIRDAHGPESLAGISSARCTNEENYLFQKLIRSLGTNSVDHCARL